MLPSIDTIVAMCRRTGGEEKKSRMRKNLKPFYKCPSPLHLFYSGSLLCWDATTSGAFEKALSRPHNFVLSPVSPLPNSDERVYLLRTYLFSPPKNCYYINVKLFSPLLVEANKRRHKKKAKRSRRTETREEEERKRKRYLKVKTHRKARKEKKRAEWGKRKMSLSLSLSLSSMPPPLLPRVMHLFSLKEKGRARALKYDLIIPYLFVRPFFCGFDRGYVAFSAFAALLQKLF